MHENNDILKKKHLIYRKQQQQKLDGYTNTAPIDLIFKTAVALKRHVIIIEQRWSISNENVGFKWCTNKKMLPLEHPNKGNDETRTDTKHI